MIVWALVLLAVVVAISMILIVCAGSETEEGRRR